MLDELYKGSSCIYCVIYIVDNIIPQSEFLQGFDITLGIDVDKLPKTLSKTIIIVY